jgi:hypothetical protein
MKILRMLKDWESYPYIDRNEVKKLDQIIQSIQQSSDDEIIELVQAAFQSGDDSLIWELLEIIAGIRRSFPRLHRELIQQKQFYPHAIFRDATAEIREELLDLLFHGELNENQTFGVMVALAWIGDERVVHLYRRWWKEAPVQIQGKTWTTDDFSYQMQRAGWQLDKDGKRKNLIWDEAFVAVPVSDSPFLISETCGCCRQPLAILFDFDLRHPEAKFLQFPGERLRIATCCFCTFLEGIFTEVDGFGNVRWSSVNQKPDLRICDHSEESLEWIRSSSLRPLTFGAPEPIHFLQHVHLGSVEEWESRIAGYPTWIQDLYFPKCPSCGLLMKYIGQFRDPDLEGLYYAHLCSDCGIACTHYQQT